MSAIGDYIYLTYRHYYFNDDSNFKWNNTHHGLSFSQAQGVFAEKREEVNKKMRTLGNRQVAKHLEKILNDFTYNPDFLDKKTKLPK